MSKTRNKNEVTLTSTSIRNKSIWSELIASFYICGRRRLQKFANAFYFEFEAAQTVWILQKMLNTEIRTVTVLGIELHDRDV